MKAFEGDAHPYKENIVKFRGVSNVVQWPREEAGVKEEVRL